MSVIILLFAQTAPANIWVKADTTIAQTNLWVLGSGNEIHHDLQVEGVDSLARLSRVPVLRFGGIASEYYAWNENGFNGRFYADYMGHVYPVDLDCGVDCFLAFCDSVGAEPLICVNTQINDPSYAADFVEYCNGDTTTPMGWIRKVRGHPQPYNVHLWELGNEQDIAGYYFDLWGVYMYRHFGKPFSQWTDTDSVFVTPQEYAHLVRSYADSMRAASPIPIEIMAPSIASNTSWMGPVLDSAGAWIDWVDVHYYPCWDVVEYSQMLAVPDTGSYWQVQIDSFLNAVQDTVDAHAPGQGIGVFLGEWNSGVQFDTATMDWFWWQYLNGLYYADFLGHLMNRGFQWAGFYCMYNDAIPPEFNYIRNDTVSMRAIGWIMRLISQHMAESTAVVQAWSDKTDPGTGLEVYSWWEGDGINLAILVINQNPDTSYNTVVRWQGMANHRRSYRAWQISNDTTLAAPFNGTTGINYLGELSCGLDSLVHTFPPYSITLLQVESSIGARETGPAKTKPTLVVRPVPSQKEVVVNMASMKPGSKLQVIDAAGRLVQTLQLKQGQSVIRWAAPGPGVYFIRVYPDQGLATQRIVITGSNP